jgi:CHAT domain-containing protein
MKPLKKQDQSKRLFWCATGAFTFVPVHAAGDYDRPHGICCSDYFVSSYTPTLNALIQAQRPRPPMLISASKALLIAAPEVPSLESLPNTVEEIAQISRLIPTNSILPLEDDEQRGLQLGSDLAMVTARLPEAVVVHLACHGLQDHADPLESGFCLRDGRLTIKNLMSFKLSNALFAFCSACETAKGDSQQPDQTIHLAAAMLFVGFRSLVATLWYSATLQEVVSRH